MCPIFVPGHLDHLDRRLLRRLYPAWIKLVQAKVPICYFTEDLIEGFFYSFKFKTKKKVEKIFFEIKINQLYPVNNKKYSLETGEDGRRGRKMGKDFHL